MRKNLALFLLLSLLLLSSCRAKGTYQDGYSDGFDIGYTLGLQSAETAPGNAPEETTGPAQTVLRLQPQPEPRNGFVFEEITGREAEATLSIRTSGSGGYYFVIDPVEFPPAGDGEFPRLQAQLQANQYFIRLYVRGGSTAEIDIPLGEYAIYYARGSDWYGEEALFGPETSYYQYDGTFKTAKSASRLSVSSKDADPISESEFPRE